MIDDLTGNVGMSCKELVELVTEYLDEALSASEHARFEAHLAECSGCTEYLGQMRLTFELVGRLGGDAIESGARDRLRDAFRDWKRGR